VHRITHTVDQGLQVGLHPEELVRRRTLPVHHRIDRRVARVQDVDVIATKELVQPYANLIIDPLLVRRRAMQLLDGLIPDGNGLLLLAEFIDATVDRVAGRADLAGNRDAVALVGCDEQCSGGEHDGGQCDNPNGNKDSGREPEA
jgi:hypothetical protein